MIELYAELKPCPFCGKPGIVVYDPEEIVIKCSDELGWCHLSLYGVHVDEWQRRPQDELKYDYEHPEKTPYRNKEQWMDVLEQGELTHADVMRLVAERDILEDKFQKLAEERDYYYQEYWVLREREQEEDDDEHK